MSTVVARRVASTPTRSAVQTWAKIVELIAPDPKSPARVELAEAAGVACSSISSEATGDAAIVIWGGGLRVRVYCVFGDDAMTGDNVNESPLPRSPTEDAWRMSIPCPAEDVKWSRNKLATVSTRITIRSDDDDIDVDESKPGSVSASQPFSINAEEFLKP